MGWSGKSGREAWPRVKVKYCKLGLEAGAPCLRDARAAAVVRAGGCLAADVILMVPCVLGVFPRTERGGGWRDEGWASVRA